MKTLVRRRIITLTVVLTILVAGLPAAATAQHLPDPTLPRPHSATGKFALLLDGVYVGILPAVSGDFPLGGLVVEDTLGNQYPYYVKKHLSKFGYPELTLVFGANMRGEFYEFITASLAGGPAIPGAPFSFRPIDGSIIALDRYNMGVSRLDFFDAVISELSIPRLEAGSKEELLFRLTIRPKYATRVSTNGWFSPPCRVTEPPYVGNFRMTLPGLRATIVSVIEPLTIKLPVPFNDNRDYDRPPPLVNFPDLEAGFPATSRTAASFEQWALDFISSGNSWDMGEQSGALQFLSRDGSTPLFTLWLDGVGIYRFEQAQAGIGPPGQSPTSRARMYVEHMRFIQRRPCVEDEPVLTH